jgi:hypothetical protein
MLPPANFPALGCGAQFVTIQTAYSVPLPMVLPWDTAPGGCGMGGVMEPSLLTLSFAGD